MSWLTGLRGACTYICPEDRYISKSDVYESYAPYEEEHRGKLKIQRSFTCPSCRKSLVNMGTRWRAPKKSNNKAWKRILLGDIWWDGKSIDKKLNKARNKWQPWSGKRKRPTHYYTQSSAVKREAHSITYSNSAITAYFKKQMSERR